MKRFLIPLLAALALPTAVNAETVFLGCKFENVNGLIELEINLNTNQGTVKSISNSKREVAYRAKQFIKSNSYSLKVNTGISTDTYTVSRIDGSATLQSILEEPYKKMLGEMGIIFRNGICNKKEKVNANNNNLYFNRGLEKQNKGDSHGAIYDFTKAIEINPQDADAYNNRGWIKEKLEDYYGAIYDFTKAIEINPQLAYAYYNRGKTKHKLEDYYGAISDFTKAIEINPQDAVLYSDRGITKGIGFKDKKGACDDFKKAASLGYQYRINWLETTGGKWCKDM